jgi:hypothetical protein
MANNVLSVSPTAKVVLSLTAERQPPQMSLFDQGLEMLLDGDRRGRLTHDETELYIPKLRGFRKVCGPDERLLAIDNDEADHEVSRAVESHRRALAEPDVRLSPHPAPIVRPRPCKSPQWANSDG